MCGKADRGKMNQGREERENGSFDEVKRDGCAWGYEREVRLSFLDSSASRFVFLFGSAQTCLALSQKIFKPGI